jgi:hypothetical protein
MQNEQDITVFKWITIQKALKERHHLAQWQRPV